MIWVLDAGHGINQKGKRSPEFIHQGEKIRFYEWASNWDLVNRVIAYLDYYNFTDYHDLNPNPLIKGSSLSWRLRELSKIKGKKVLVSFHSNAFGDNVFTSPRGMETFYYPQDYISKELALRLHFPIVEKFGFRDRGIKKKGFRILQGDCPSILLEILFYTNKKDLELLMNNQFRDKLCKHIAEQIIDLSKDADFLKTMDQWQKIV